MDIPERPAAHALNFFVRDGGGSMTTHRPEPPDNSDAPSEKEEEEGPDGHS